VYRQHNKYVIAFILLNVFNKKWMEDKEMNLKRIIILSLLIMSLASTSANASSAFTQYYVPKNSSPVFVGIDNSRNVKENTNTAWWVKATTIVYNPSNAYVGYGLRFTPMKKSSAGVYSIAGGGYKWIKTASNTPKYGDWGTNGEIGTSYYLGVRLDTGFDGNYATTAGEWNAR